MDKDIAKKLFATLVNILDEYNIVDETNPEIATNFWIHIDEEEN